MGKRADRATVANLARAAREMRSAAYWEGAEGSEYARAEWAIFFSWLFAGLADTKSPGHVSP